MAIEQLSDFEKTVYCELAKLLDSTIKDYSLSQILKELENHRHQEGLNDLALLILNSKAMDLGDPGWHIPIARRKSIEAFRLVFPDKEVQQCGFGG